MKKHELFDIIRAPVVNEKSTAAQEFNKTTFLVARHATKPQIRDAVEKIFKVSVVSVNTINQVGKAKRHRNRPGRRNDYKKAIVTLAEGQMIDVYGV